jgi:hypothetical protein
VSDNSVEKTPGSVLYAKREAEPFRCSVMERPPGSNRARTSRLQPPWCRCACESELKMEIPDKVSRTSAKGSAFVLLLASFC